RISRTHQIGHHVHGAPCHGAVKERADLLLALFWCHPVVGWAGVVFAPRADERHLLGPRYIARIATMQDTVWICPFVQVNRPPLSDQPFHHLLRFAFRSIAPDDLLRPHLLSRFFNPLLEPCSQVFSVPRLSDRVLYMAS